MFNRTSFRVIALVVAFTVVLGVSLYTVNKLVFANSCERTYGGGKECDRSLKITKEVSKDQDKLNKNKDYSDSIILKSNERNKLVTFRIEVENKGDVDEEDLKVIDKLPEVFEKVEGALTEEIERIDNGDKITYYITVRVKSSAFDEGRCVVNEVRLRGDMNDEGGDETIDTDTATVCFGREITQLPKTGNEEAVVATLLGFGLIATGFGLRKATETVR